MISISSKKSKKQFLPFQNLSINLKIQGYFADVSIKQNFLNENLFSPEIIYFFPIRKNIFISQFQCQINGNRSIQTEIQENLFQKSNFSKQFQLNENFDEIFLIDLGESKQEIKKKIFSTSFFFSL